MNSGPAVIAHRGASRAARENTVDAFRLARRLGATWVELDVRVAADGVLVVHHDARYDDGRAVSDVDARERPAHVPTLDVALDACAGMGVNVGIKNAAGEPGYDPAAGPADAVVAALHRRVRDEPPILVSSFDPAVLARVRALDASIPLALLTFELPDASAVVAAAVAAGCAALHPFDRTVDAALVERAHGAGLAVNVWTVDDPARISELARLGVDGVCTNVPDVAVAALAGPGSAGATGSPGR